MSKNIIKDLLEQHVTVIQAFVKSNARQIDHLMGALPIAIDYGNKILICGNGGSASDSNHFAAELIGRFEKNRKALPAISLTADNSVLTCLANDFGYETVFAKQIEALGNTGDILIAISTSGRSQNIIRAMEQAKKQGLMVILFTGINGKTCELADLVIDVPTDNTARIQECHIFLIHLLSKAIEDYFIEKQGVLK